MYLTPCVRFRVCVARFAFVFVESQADAKKAIKEVNGRKLKDSPLTVAMAHKKERTKVISGEGKAGAVVDGGWREAALLYDVAMNAVQLGS